MQRFSLTLTALLALTLPALATADKVAALNENQCAPSPQQSLQGNPANGQVLHAEHCAACHGLDGKANVVVMHMDSTPPDQSDPNYMNNLPDAYLYLAICKGGEGIGKSYVMSPWGDFFSDTEITDLIAWIRTFSAS
jgi:mono/diheme cytochrome c family protein